MAVTVDEVIVSLEAKLGTYNANIKSAERQFTSSMGVIRTALGTYNANIKSAERQFTSSMGVIRTAADSVTHKIEGISSGLRTAFKVFGAVELVRVLAEIGRVGEEAVDKVAKIGEVAQKIGLTNTQLQGLENAAKKAGVSVTTLDDGMLHFAKNIALAQHGFGELAPDLKANNVQLEDATGKLRPLNDILADFADLIKGAATEGDALVLATRAFGRDVGGELVPILRGGTKALRDFQDAGKESGGRFFTDQQIADARELKERFEELNDALSHAAGTFAIWAGNALYEIGRVEHGVVDAVAGVLDAIANPDASKSVGQLKADLSDIEASIATLEETIVVQGVVDPSFQAELDHLNAQADSLRGKIASASRINVEGGPGGAGSPDPGPLQRTTVVSDKPPPHTRSGGGGGRTPQQEFRDAVEQSQQRTRALLAEADAIGKNTFEVAKAQAAFDLWEAAKKAGIKTTPELTAQIDALSTAYGNAAIVIEQAQIAVDKLDEMRDTAKDVLGGVVDDLRAGASAAEIFTNALTKIEDKLLDIVENQLIDALFGKAGTTGTGVFGNLLGSVLGSLGGSGAGAGLSGPGLFARGGIARRPSIAGEGGPEAVVPLSDGRTIPVRLSVPPQLGGQTVMRNEIRVINPPGVPMEADARDVPDGRGGRRTDIVMREVTAAGIQSSHGRRALQNVSGQPGSLVRA